MSASSIEMPKLGLTMTEGLLSEWCVAPGVAFAAGQIVCVVETEKISNEVEAQADGVIEEILVQAGETVPVGTMIARLRGAGPAAAGPAAPPARRIATPLARRLARDHGVDLGALTGSGPGGRIKAADVLASVPAAPPEPVIEAPVPQKPAPRPETRAARLQAVAARRMVQAKQEIPHFYLSRDAEISDLLDLRGRLNADSGRPRLSLNDFLLLAVGRALERLPAARTVWRDDGPEMLSGSDVGVAVQTEAGLLAPVLRGVGLLDIDRVAAGSAALIGRARQGQLTADDLVGGAIAVSNLGMHGVAYVTPIVNPGQAAILGVGAMRQVFRPDAEGAPRLCREIGLVLSCDHRVLDGVGGAALLQAIVEALENPLGLLRTPAATRN